MSDRPPPAARKGNPAVTVSGEETRRALGISTIKQTGETCPLCLNRANNVVIVFSAQPFMRAALIACAVAALGAFAFAIASWVAPSEYMVANSYHDHMLNKGK